MSLTIIDHPSVNFGPRPHGAKILGIVMHADVSPKEQITLQWLGNPVSKASYHYLVGRVGQIWRLVNEQDRAWHAGKAHMLGNDDPNDFTVGVCISNKQDGEKFTELALDKAAELCEEICRRYFIPVDAAHVTTHSAIATPPGRKKDPYSAVAGIWDHEAFLARIRAWSHVPVPASDQPDTPEPP